MSQRLRHQGLGFWSGRTKPVPRQMSLLIGPTCSAQRSPRTAKDNMRNEDRILKIAHRLPWCCLRLKQKIESLGNFAGAVSSHTCFPNDTIDVIDALLSPYDLCSRPGVGPEVPLSPLLRRPPD